VLKATAKADGSATLEVRGKDGSLTCNISAEGAGECTAMGNGGAAVSWTRDEALTIAADEALMSY